MKVSTKFFTIALLLLFARNTEAQEYSTGIGIRGGYITPGLTVKHFINEHAAIEGIIGSRWHGFSITALYEMHKDGALGIDNLDWQYGAGAHLGYYNGYYYYYYKNGTYYTREKGNVAAIGINGIFGLEYKFQEIPFTLSFDFMPYFDFTYRGTGFIDAGLSFRYVF